VLLLCLLLGTVRQVIIVIIIIIIIFFFFFFFFFFTQYLLISAASDLRCLSSLPGIPLLPCNVRNFTLVTATWKNSLSARRVAAGNHLCKDVGVLREGITYLEQILH
jgi:hypothetical protein